MTHDQQGGRSKLLGLEMIRFACAMTVLVWHFHHFAMVGDGAAMQLPHEPLYALLWPMYEYGLFGVQIFWCISGFIFYWNYADAIAARRVEPKRFFWLRFSRLYPLHFVTLLIIAGLQPLYGQVTGHWFIFEGGAANFLLQLGLADQWTGPRTLSFNGPIWSVSAEVFVYVGFFMLVRAFGKARWLIGGAIGVALLSIWSGATSAALICGGYFFAGGAAAECLRSERVRQHLGAARILAAAMIGMAIAVGTIVDLGDQLRIMPTWLMWICPPLLFLAAQKMPALDRWQKPIQAAGNLTYSTYLIHFPVQLIVAIVALSAGIALPVGEAWFLLAYLATVIILGRIIFLRFEAPAQAWIRAATLAPARTRAAT